MVVAIYASIGVEYFAGEVPPNFCDFLHAFYTLFGLVAYSQATGLAAFNDAGGVRSGVASYLYSFVGIVVFVLLQVVVAVTLESFYRARQQFKEEAAHEAAVQSRFDAGEDSDALGNPLDPLLEELTVAYDSDRSLKLRIDAIFARLDVDGLGTLSRAELLERLAVLGVRLSRADFDRLTDGRKLCSQYFEMTRVQFMQAMLRQLKTFAQRRLADSLHLEDLGVDMSALLSTVKFTILELEQAYNEAHSLRDDVRGLEREVAVLRSNLDDRFDAILAAVAGAARHPPQRTSSTAAAAARRRRNTAAVLGAVGGCDSDEDSEEEEGTSREEDEEWSADVSKSGAGAEEPTDVPSWIVEKAPNVIIGGDSGKFCHGGGVYGERGSEGPSVLEDSGAGVGPLRGINAADRASVGTSAAGVDDASISRDGKPPVLATAALSLLVVQSAFPRQGLLHAGGSGGRRRDESESPRHGALGVVKGDARTAATTDSSEVASGVAGLQPPLLMSAGLVSTAIADLAFSQQPVPCNPTATADPALLAADLVPAEAAEMEEMESQPAVRGEDEEGESQPAAWWGGQLLPQAGTFVSM